MAYPAPPSSLCQPVKTQTDTQKMTDFSTLTKQMAAITVAKEIPLYWPDGRDVKCWYCNSRFCDSEKDGVYYHADCHNPDPRPGDMTRDDWLTLDCDAAIEGLDQLIAQSESVAQKVEGGAGKPTPTVADRK